MGTRRARPAAPRERARDWDNIGTVIAVCDRTGTAVQPGEPAGRGSGEGVGQALAAHGNGGGDDVQLVGVKPASLQLGVPVGVVYV